MGCLGAPRVRVTGSSPQVSLGLYIRAELVRELEVKMRSGIYVYSVSWGKAQKAP